MDKIYTSELDKPELNEETLAHYGVLGMKWGVRKNPEKAFGKAQKKSNKYSKKVYKNRKRYLKEAKKVSRFFGRKKAQDKVVRLNAKKDYLESKKDKWDKNIEKVFTKEYDRIRKTSKTDEEKDSRLRRLEEGYSKGKIPTTTKVKKYDTAATSEKKSALKKELKDRIKKTYLEDNFDGYINPKNPGSFKDTVSRTEIKGVQKSFNTYKKIPYKDVANAFEEAYNEKYFKKKK